MRIGGCRLLQLFLLLLIAFTYVIQAQSTGDLRLVNSASTNALSGHLEIYLRGEWGTVCDDSFDIADAIVACRQLGYSSVARFGNVVDLRFPTPSSFTQIWLDDLRCDGFDTTLLACRHNGIGDHNCAHHEDVALVCSDAIPSNGSDLRLVNSSSLNATAGRLEIFLNGEWGTVCSSSFRISEGDVVCNQLGFPPSSRVGSVTTLGYASASSSVEIWLDYVSCGLEVTTFSSCRQSGTGVRFCSHSQDVAVVCGPRDCFADEFQCRNMRCILSDRICDGRDDCGDFSDETDQSCIDKRKMELQEVRDSVDASLRLTLGLAFGLPIGVALVLGLVLLACMLIPQCPIRKLYSSKPVLAESDVGESEQPTEQPSRGNTYQLLTGTQT